MLLLLLIDQTPKGNDPIFESLIFSAMSRFITLLQHANAYDPAATGGRLMSGLLHALDSDKIRIDPCLKLLVEYQRFRRLGVAPASGLGYLLGHAIASRIHAYRHHRRGDETSAQRLFRVPALSAYSDRN